MKGTNYIDHRFPCKDMIGQILVIGGAFNSVDNINHLTAIATAISEIAEDKLGEPEAIKNIGLDCKPFIANEPEEAQQADA